MYKKIMLLFCLCSILVNFTIAGKTVNAATKYVGGNAAQYAEKWALKYNTKKYYKAELDCTNFVSQCLVAGGKKVSSKLPSYSDTNYWRPHSATWENANYFKKYWVKKVQSTGKSIAKMNKKQLNSFSSNITSILKPGDVIQYGYGSDNMKHSQICNDSGKGTSGYFTLKMAQHTDNKKNIDLHDYMLSTYYSYVRYYNMSKLK